MSFILILNGVEAKLQFPVVLNQCLAVSQGRPGADGARGMPGEAGGKAHAFIYSLIPLFINVFIHSFVCLCIDFIAS